MQRELKAKTAQLIFPVLPRDGSQPAFDLCCSCSGLPNEGRLRTGFPGQGCDWAWLRWNSRGNLDISDEKKKKQFTLKTSNLYKRRNAIFDYFWPPTAEVSNSKGPAGRMRLKVWSRGLHENKIFELCVKISLIGKIRKIAQFFPSNLQFFWCSRAALDPLAGPMWTAGRVFETPALQHILWHKCFSNVITKSLILPVTLKVLHGWPFLNIKLVYLIKIGIAQTRFAENVTFCALKYFLWRPDGFVTDGTLDGAENNGHLGRIRAGRLEIVAADPSGQCL